MVQSLLVGFFEVAFEGSNGTYTGVPALKVTDGKYWSKNGSNIMTSSPSSKNAVNTAYCPEILLDRISLDIHSFVGMLPSFAPLETRISVSTSSFLLNRGS